MGFFVWLMAMFFNVITILFVCVRMVMSPPHEWHVLFFALGLLFIPLINIIALVWAKSTD